MKSKSKYFTFKWEIATGPNRNGDYFPKEALVKEALAKEALAIAHEELLNGGTHEHISMGCICPSSKCSICGEKINEQESFRNS